MAEPKFVRQQPVADIAAHLAILYTVGYFGVVFSMLHGGIPPDNKDMVGQLIGGLTIIQTTIISFIFRRTDVKGRDTAQRSTDERKLEAKP